MANRARAFPLRARSNAQTPTITVTQDHSPATRACPVLIKKRSTRKARDASVRSVIISLSVLRQGFSLIRPPGGVAGKARLLREPKVSGRVPPRARHRPPDEGLGQHHRRVLAPGAGLYE